MCRPAVSIVANICFNVVGLCNCCAAHRRRSATDSTMRGNSIVSDADAERRRYPNLSFVLVCFFHIYIWIYVLIYIYVEHVR